MRLICVACVIGLLTTSCSGGKQLSRVEYAIKNESGQRLNDVIVRIDSVHSFEHGVLVSGTQSGFSGEVALQAENHVTISWKDAAGKAYEFTVVANRATLVDKRVCRFVVDKEMRVKQAW
jgi:hypothetical protein